MIIINLDLTSEVPQQVVVIVGSESSTMSVKAICRCHLGTSNVIALGESNLVFTLLISFSMSFSSDYLMAFACAFRVCLGSPEIRLAEHEVGQKTSKMFG